MRIILFFSFSLALFAEELEENFFDNSVESVFYAIPLCDYCIDRIEGKKVYLKNENVLISNYICYLNTSSFGKLVLKNLSKDEQGYYLPKITIIVKENQKNQCSKVNFSISLCGYNEEVEQHLSDAVKHSLETAAAVAGAVVASSAGQPIIGGISAAIAGECANELIKDIRQTYESYNNDANNHVRDNIVRESLDTRDTAAGW